MGYLGWVPNITGRLSFSALSRSHHTIKHTEHSAPRGANGPRLIVVHHRRVTNDKASRAIARALIPKLLRPHRWFRGDRFDYFVILEGNETDDELTGRIYITRPRLGDEWRDAFHQQLNDYLDRKIPIELAVARIKNAFSGKLEGNNLANVMFADVILGRSGRCSIDVGSESLITWPLPPHRAMYIFMFMRDLFHKHYHHSDTDDRLLPLCKDDDKSWRLETEKSLYRSVIEARRPREGKYLAEAEGRLEYLKAFRTRFSPSACDRHLEELSSSLRASAEQHVLQSESKTVRTSLFVAVPFLLFEVFIHLSELAEHAEAKPKPDGLRAFYEWTYTILSEHVPFCVAALIVCLFMYALRLRVIDYRDWRLYKAIVRAYSEDVYLGRRTRILVQKVASSVVMWSGYALFAGSIVWHFYGSAFLSLFKGSPHN